KEDIKYNFNQTALNLMMDLGVYDSTKDEDNAVKVTKAEFAELICKLTNVHDRVKDDKTSTFYMKDVLESHWANSFIQWVLGNGIMTLDDGNFEPERLVDTQTVITATINLLGRNFAVKLPGGVQRDIYFSDLKSGISKGFNEELMKGEIAQVFYNSLDLNMYEVIKYGEENEIAERKGVTILSQYRDVYKAKGIITGNEFTHLNGKSELESDQVEIDGDKYFFGNVDCSEYLGLAVEFYYKQLKNDEDKTLVSVLVNKENTITYIDSRDISSDTTNSRITFDKNGN
ncbi:MAG: S-layer homology domain-containing protein, partial [Oscillospiraceae bacterium]